MRSPRLRVALGMVAAAAFLSATKTTHAWDLPSATGPALGQSSPDEGFLWVDPHGRIGSQQVGGRPQAAPLAPAPARPEAQTGAVPVAPPQSLLAQPPTVGAQAREAPPRPLPPAPTPPYPVESALAYRAPAYRLASIPNMYGDFLGAPGTVSIVRSVEQFGPVSSYDLPPYFDQRYPTARVEIPPPGGASRMKISENNRALPSDRLYFAYSHFHGALEANASPTVTYPIDRYVFGCEKTFLSGLWSAELRMPISSDFMFASNGFQVERQEVGNLSVIVKRLVWQTDETAVAVGLGVETPTGTDLRGTSGLTRFEVSNQAVHLSPFIGFMRTPEDSYFYQGFLQVDVPTNGNPVVFGSADLGHYTEQTLLLIDLSMGYWLRRNPAAFYFRGLAVVAEFHYATTLQNSDVVSGFEPTTFDFLHVANPMNRVDMVDFTIGLHAEVGQTTVRVGGVFPVNTDEERLFDAEVQVQVNRYF